MRSHPGRGTFPAAPQHTINKSHFADFGRSRLLPGPVAEVPVPSDSPMRREWVVICDAPDYPACVTGWEHPGQDQSGGQDRIFEALWSVDPQVVRSAARIGTELAAAAFPEIPRRIAARLSEEPGPSSADLRRASGFFERTLDYLAEALKPADLELPAYEAAQGPTGGATTQASTSVCGPPLSWLSATPARSIRSGDDNQSGRWLAAAPVSLR